MNRSTINAAPFLAASVLLTYGGCAEKTSTAAIARPDVVKTFPQPIPPEKDAAAAEKSANESLDKARQKFSEVASEVEKKVKDIGGGASKATQQVKETAEKASAAAKESAERASAVAKEKYDVAREKVRYGYDKARKDIDHLTEDVNEYVRDNPGKAVLMAAGIGFVLGLLMRGRRD